MVKVDVEKEKVNSKTVFVCRGEREEEIPVEVLEASKTSLPEAHTKGEQMAHLAIELRRHRGDSICRIPFCTTVEAEALGGSVKLGDEKYGPRVDGYVLNSIEDFYRLREMDLSRGRISEVLEAVNILSSNGELTALCVEGPFTVLSSLMEPGLFYRALRKERKAAEAFLQIIEDSLVKYILEGIKRGANIISYADPVGSIDIVGLRIYQEYSGRRTRDILKRIESQSENALLHICGKASASLEKSGFCCIEPLAPEDTDGAVGLSYGEALCRLSEDKKGVMLIGNSCIKQSYLKMKKPELWQVRLT